ncbi:unnamed protein product [Arabidopsis lyrata]|uniref:Uncharacterized protein n=1 Tax=Arabidopsis lyrata subsp. lyrata TaxID=81972 RepID=D7MWE7_ARALL|nr:UPF0725 protein At1g23950 [Arabidopsis lyrata subsp. lyrata]EFH39134.1 hypothetical protein ARALYDRAFT_920182 [Arabidopsis lyrata subsp. lyrata]CAH8265404.1 unnamed protein product [Arabidopsis lyrata]|eukprot:XP_002862875.1 UPF0725 protein At1g23950 [Arabidopsis lyrata subsp. lyrata]
MTTSWFEDAQAFLRGQNEYWRQVNESEGFDLEGILAPPGTTGLMIHNCKDGFGFRVDYRVDLYAKLGLHRYNMLKGTNFQLDELIKFNMLMNMVSAYHITLVASDPASGSVLTFQVKVEEHMVNRLNVTVSIARPKGTIEPLPLLDDLKADRAHHELHDDDGLSQWPSEDAFNDTKRFYMVEESELQDTDWIRLYLELVLCSKDRRLRASDLSMLKIVKVAVETSDEDVEPPNERLNAKTASFYITFHLAIWGIREDVERRAIVRRVLSRTGNLILLDTLTPFKKDTGLNKRIMEASMADRLAATTNPSMFRSRR